MIHHVHRFTKTYITLLAFCAIGLCFFPVPKVDSQVIIGEQPKPVQPNQADLTDIFTRNLTNGAYGIDVMALKKILSLELGIDIGGSATYDNATAAAVKRLQEKYPIEILIPAGIQVGTGTVGPATISVLNKLVRTHNIRATDFTLPAPETPVTNIFLRTLSIGSTGDDVLLLKKILGDDPKTAVASGLSSNVYDTATADAVCRFQLKYASEILTPSGLTQCTGSVGPTTLRKFNALAKGDQSTLATLPSGGVSGGGSTGGQTSGGTLSGSVSGGVSGATGGTASAAARITEFSIAGYKGIIDHISRTVDIILPPVTNYASIDLRQQANDASWPFKASGYPKVQTSPWANISFIQTPQIKINGTAISPVPSIAQDFSKPVKYTVTGKLPSGSNVISEYTVQARKIGCPNWTLRTPIVAKVTDYKWVNYMGFGNHTFGFATGYAIYSLSLQSPFSNSPVDAAIRQYCNLPQPVSLMYVPSFLNQNPLGYGKGTNEYFRGEVESRVDRHPSGQWEAISCTGTLGIEILGCNTSHMQQYKSGSIGKNP